MTCWAAAVFWFGVAKRAAVGWPSPSAAAAAVLVPPAREVMGRMPGLAAGACDDAWMMEERSCAALTIGCTAVTCCG